MPLKRGIYVGPRPDLKGHSALLDLEREPGRAMAQFDDPTAGMGAGWHDFGPEAFDQVKTVSWAQDEQPELPLVESTLRSAPNYESQGAGSDPGAVGYENQGRSAQQEQG